MANQRRFNSFNIDLNRNLLLGVPETSYNNNESIPFEYDKVIPNIIENKLSNMFNYVLKKRNSNEYIKLSSILNENTMPIYPKILCNLNYFYNTIKLVLTHGMSKLSKIIPEGQYILENGIFFGGKELSNEHAYLIDFLCNQFEKEFGINLINTITNQAVVIDVHTGLGKKGIDTLFINQEGYEPLCKLLPSYAQQDS